MCWEQGCNKTSPHTVCHVLAVPSCGSPLVAAPYSQSSGPRHPAGRLFLGLERAIVLCRAATSSFLDEPCLLRSATQKTQWSQSSFYIRKFTTVQWKDVMIHNFQMYLINTKLICYWTYTTPPHKKKKFSSKVWHQLHFLKMFLKSLKLTMSKLIWSNL